jgi:hypothetical protein
MFVIDYDLTNVFSVVGNALFYFSCFVVFGILRFRNHFNFIFLALHFIFSYSAFNLLFL